MTNTTPIVPPPDGTVFSRDPVRITTALFVVAQGLASILTATEVLSATVGGIIMAGVTALWGGVNLLMVKPATVPVQPLQELAYAEQQRGGGGGSS